MREVILVRPEEPENTGLVARLASNFEFQLRIVDPVFNLREARKTANNSQKKIREATIHSTIEEAKKSSGSIYGSRPDGDPLQQVDFPRECSILVGPESHGLDNSELAICKKTVAIETEGYSSLNQSHAAAILMYEISVV